MRGCTQTTSASACISALTVIQSTSWGRHTWQNDFDCFYFTEPWLGVDNRLHVRRSPWCDIWGIRGLLGGPWRRWVLCQPAGWHRKHPKWLDARHCTPHPGQLEPRRPWADSTAREEAPTGNLPWWLLDCGNTCRKMTCFDTLTQNAVRFSVNIWWKTNCKLFCRIFLRFGLPNILKPVKTWSHVAFYNEPGTRAHKVCDAWSCLQ